MRIGLREVILVMAAVAVGCPSETDDDDASPIGDDDDASPGGACDPPLTIPQSLHQVLPLDLVLFNGDGGTGDYRWEFETNESGGLLNERTGAYLAGNVAEVTDTLRVRDTGCDDEATATVEVLSPLQVRPNRVSVPPGTSVVYDVTLGSGSYLCSLSSDGSGAIVSEDCTYTAGGAVGLDLLRVEDTVTGEFVLREVNVDPTAVLSHDPERLALPLDTVHLLRPLGGSGFLEIATDQTSVVESDGVYLEAVGAGHAEVSLTDIYTRQVTTISVDVVAPVPVDMLPWADVAHPGKARSADLNGDGHVDFVLSHPAIAVHGKRGGGVVVYAGTADGLDPTPVQVFGGDSNDEWGFGLDLADFDGDGELDLVVGAEEDDDGGGNAGAVFVFSGLPSGFFSDVASETLLGPRGNLRFGRSVAACDYDGDGLQDLAVGAFEDENQAADATQDNQGAVYVHLGTPTGLAPLPSQILWGREYAAGAWFDDRDQRFGLYLDGGDVDGDGRCELAASTYLFDGSVFNDQGIVVLFQGTETGVAIEPWRAFTQRDQEETSPAEIGRAIAFGDADGDGLADLLVGASRQSLPDRNTVQEGIVHLFRATTLVAGTDGLSDINESDWSWGGDSNNDQVGLWVNLADIDGDGIDDVLVGATQDEVEGGPDYPGTVSGFIGVDGGIPSDTAAFEWGGVVSGDWFGAWGAALDDYDGDGLSDLGVFAARSNAIGIEVGMPYTVHTADGALTELVWPASPANHDFGSGIAFLPDLDGDGSDELLIGSDETGRHHEVRRTGRILLYDRPDSESPLVLEAWPGHGGEDRTGRDVAAVGDFDGDGFGDVAVLSHDDHHPSSFDPGSFSNPDECPAGRSDTGSVWIFRGTGAGIETTPSFVSYGPQSNQSLNRLASGDVDGDGRADVIMASPFLDRPGEGGGDAGGFGVMTGRGWSGSGIDVICDPWFHIGRQGSDNLGWAVASIGDLDGDGCDEFGVGAYREDLGSSNQGTARIVYGWGPGCARSSAEVVVLGGGQSNANLGIGMQGGIDVTADGVPDLVVGADNHTVGGTQVGRAYLLSGAWLATLTPEPLVEGAEPVTVHPITDLDARWFVEGRIDEEDFGRGVALVPSLNPPFGGLVVGSPGGGQAGLANTGGGRLYAVVDLDGEPGIAEEASLVISGESWHIGSRLGDRVAAGTVEGTPWIALGSTACDGDYVDSGCVYAMPVTP